MNSNDAVRLFIIADGYATYHDPAFQLTTGTRTISVSRITVQPGISEPFLVDELFGDTLPPLQGYRSTVRVYDENEVRENEILSVSSYYDNGDVRMVSEYLSMENNLLIIPGSVFSEAKTHFRISFAAANETIQKGLDILHRIADQ